MKSAHLPRSLILCDTSKMSFQEAQGDLFRSRLDAAVMLDDLRMPPSNRLEALSGDRAGQWSIRINDQWRVCFRFENGGLYDVEITDQRPVTAEVALLLGKAFGQAPRYWINLQAAYDLKMAEKVVSRRLAEIRELGHA